MMELFETKSEKGKTIPITTTQILAAWKKVKAAGGSGGVDGKSLLDVEENLSKELYKLWNRMASGSYFPQAVKVCIIPKATEGERVLGIPTVIDRVAQQVVKDILEPDLEKVFHSDSYGYRPGRGSIEAVRQCAQRCNKRAWVIDLDIKGFFDNIDHELMLKAVSKHTNQKWLLMYVDRWLKALVHKQDGTMQERDKGTPQGGVISPLLANLFLHYTFDQWVKKTMPYVEFERYADDCVVHCRTEQEAHGVLEKIKDRMKSCRLELHSDKTKIVYCKQGKWQKKYKQICFDFLGYRFKPRKINTEGKYYLGYGPAISPKATKRIVQYFKDLKIHRATNVEIGDLAARLAPQIRGWMNYYGKYRKWSLHYVFRCLNDRLVKWIMNKYKKYKNRKRLARIKLKEIAKDYPKMFLHWDHGFIPG